MFYSFPDILKLLSTHGIYFLVHSVSIIKFHEVIDLEK